MRKEPNTSSAVSKILPINHFACVEYLPLSAEGWVYLGDFFHKDPAFIQRKYLGTEISFAETLTRFQETKPDDLPKQKTILERLVEISWNSAPKNTLKALQLFKTYHEEAGTLELVPELDFDLFLAENIQDQLSSQQRADYKYKSFDVFINGVKLKDGSITEGQLKNLNLMRIGDYSTLPSFSECGWEPLFSYINRSRKTVINFEKQNSKIAGLLEKLSSKEGHKIAIDSFVIDENTSEEDFIIKFGKIINFDRFNATGTYYLPDGDAGFMEVVFKDKKAFSYQRSFYC